MPGRTPAEAYRNFRGPLQQSLSCVSDAVFVSSHRHAEAGGVRSIKVPKNAGFIPLAGSKRLHLSAGLEYQVVLFHWHPESSDRTYPHIHLGSSQLLPTAVVGHGDHIPSGRLSFELVLLYLIREQGVVPRRSDWAEVLGANNANFTQWRTWH